MITTMNNPYCLGLTGKSTDVKPIGKYFDAKNDAVVTNFTDANLILSQGSTFLEKNTSTNETKVYEYFVTGTTVGEVTTYTGSWVEL